MRKKDQLCRKFSDFQDTKAYEAIIQAATVMSVAALAALGEHLVGSLGRKTDSDD